MLRKKETPWEDLFNKGPYFARSTIFAVLYGQQRVKLWNIFGEQVMITLGTFLCTWVLISFKTFMWIIIEDECLF